MKKIQKEITTYKEVFVSVDGREFSTADDCKMWEESYKGTMGASWELIKKEQVNPYDICISGANEESEIYVLVPKDLNEITLINAYVDSLGCYYSRKLTTEHIGKLIAMDFGYDRDYCDICILSDHIEKLKKNVATLTEKFNTEL